jgi:hypothetical protein
VASLLSAAAVLLVLAAVGATVAVVDDDDRPSAAPPASATAPPEQMESLVEGGVSGWVSLTEQRWGTRIDLTCTYSGNGYDGWVWYALLVRTENGPLEQVGTWRAEPGEEMHVTMAASVPPKEIASVVVRAASGRSVLRLDRTPSATGP